LLFSNPPPTPADLGRYYSEQGPWAASRVEKTSRIEAKHLCRSKSKRRKQRTVVRTRDVLFDGLEPYVSVRTPVPGSRVLDFGCGDGSKFLDRLQDWGWETFGIEPSTGVAFLRHHRLETPPQDGRFELAILSHVLEHVLNPLAVLQQMAGAVRDGGALFVSVPRLDTAAQHGDLRYCLDGRNHVACFSEACLTGLLARAGFVVARRVDGQVDTVLTEGKPLRLRLVAIRTSSPPAVSSRPLDAAVQALRAYAAANGGTRRLLKLLPVRMRAALLDRAREKSRRRLHG
jgi:SAM-dependent methyltransferase